jgi:hypothetical protein
VSPTTVVASHSVAPTLRALRPLLGADVMVRTPSTHWRGTLLSCVRESAWFVVDDVDVVVPLDEILSIHAA